MEDRRDSPERTISAAVDALCNITREGEQKEHLEVLRHAARESPLLLLPYLNDGRETKVFSEGKFFKNDHLPYPVWQEVDIILCHQYGVKKHESRADAAECWRVFFANSKK
jgi:hypothetical protein